jgi:hypothetical protein
MSSMSHNSSVITNFKGEHVFKFEDSPSNDDENGVDGLNHSPCLVKPLVTVILYLIFKSCAPSMMNSTPLTWVSNLEPLVTC